MTGMSSFERIHPLHVCTLEDAAPSLTSIHRRFAVGHARKIRRSLVTGCPEYMTPPGFVEQFDPWNARSPRLRRAASHFRCGVRPRARRADRGGRKGQVGPQQPAPPRPRGRWPMVNAGSSCSGIQLRRETRTSRSALAVTSARWGAGSKSRGDPGAARLPVLEAEARCQEAMAGPRACGKKFAARPNREGQTRVLGTRVTRPRSRAARRRPAGVTQRPTKDRRKKPCEGDSPFRASALEGGVARVRPETWAPRPFARLSRSSATRLRERRFPAADRSREPGGRVQGRSADARGKVRRAAGRSPDAIVWLEEGGRPGDPRLLPALADFLPAWSAHRADAGRRLCRLFNARRETSIEKRLMRPRS